MLPLEDNFEYFKLHILGLGIGQRLIMGVFNVKEMVDRKCLCCHL